MTPEEKIQSALINGTKKIEEVFAAYINPIQLKIALLEEAGQDPKKYFDDDDLVFVDFYEQLEAYTSERNKAIEAFENKIDEQLKELEAAQAAGEVPAEAPTSWEQVAFEVIKYALTEGVKIKVGDVEWDSTKPLGGEGSVFDDLRNAAMKSLGIDPDSEFGKIIKDPINAVSDLGENLDAEAKKILTDAKRKADKALTDVKRESDKALTDAKREIDKGLTDVKKATDKALTDARKTVDKAIKDVTREIAKVIPKVKIKVKIKVPTIKW